MKTTSRRYKEIVSIHVTKTVGLLLIIGVAVGVGLLGYWIYTIIAAEWDNIIKSIIGFFVPHL